MVTPPEIVKKMAECFKALGDPTRLMIIKLLASNMEDKICVVELAKMLDVTQPAASQHIKILRNVGLLEPKKEGYHVYYYINKDVLRAYKKDFNALYDMAFQKCKNYPDCGAYKK
ncbi:MAG: winged helix-turn-helix transcriptional regulator [Candidatus Aenigmarchaeota archaeon]|nr:winged helix-turn-helix transcriptional regulator [Candidatus Aenigmarchaeota archaeon]